MTTIPLRRAVAGEWPHRHFRTSGWGWVDHQHALHSYVHSHPGSGLRLVRLGWSAYRWTEIRGRAIALVPVALVGLVWILHGLAVFVLLMALTFLASHLR